VQNENRKTGKSHNERGAVLIQRFVSINQELKRGCCSSVAANIDDRIDQQAT
jgi:hypothetical protein